MSTLKRKFGAYFFMPEADLIELFVRPLHELEIRYLVSGSVAAMLYGEPRVTHDIDLIIYLRDEHLAQLPGAFPAAEFYLPPAEVIAVEMVRERHGHFNVIHSGTGLKADCYTANKDELHTWALRHAREYRLEGASISVAPPEYVIVRKLEYFREGGSEKHLRDIRAMLSISPQEIDRTVIQDWVDRRRLTFEWQQAVETR